MARNYLYACLHAVDLAAALRGDEERRIPIMCLRSSAIPPSLSWQPRPLGVCRIYFYTERPPTPLGTVLLTMPVSEALKRCHLHKLEGDIVHLANWGRLRALERTSRTTPETELVLVDFPLFLYRDLGVTLQLMGSDECSCGCGELLVEVREFVDFLLAIEETRELLDFRDATGVAL